VAVVVALSAKAAVLESLRSGFNVGGRKLDRAVGGLAGGVSRKGFSPG
jgi:hypothetical protein